MRGRNKNRRDKSIPTVSEAGKAEKPRIKSMDELDQLVLRLKVLGDSRSAVDRSSIAHNIIKCIPKFGFISKHPIPAHRFRALRWVVKETCRLIRIESNQAVLFWLVRLASEYSCGYRTRRFTEYDEANAMRLVNFVLEKNSDASIRSAALDMMAQCSAVGPPEESEQLARICHGFLVEFLARKGKLPEEPLKSACFFVCNGQWEDAEVPLTLNVLCYLLNSRGHRGDLRDLMHELARDKEVMGFIFGLVGIGSYMELRDRNSADEFIAYLLRHSRRTDREYLMSEYGDKLRKTFMGMCSYLLRVSVYKHNVAALFVNDSTLSGLAYRRMTRKPRDDWFGERFVMAARLLKCGLQIGDEALQRMLGIGLLYSAGHFAALDYDGDDEEADTYRAVLAAHPEWKQRFREMTEVEEAISHTAQLGETIPARTTKRGEYVMDI